MANTTTRTRRLRPTNPPIPMRARAPWSDEAFRMRALELMRLHEASGTTGRSRASALRADGQLDWLEVVVASASVADLSYTVRYEAEADFARCDCPAGRAMQPCWHAGVALEGGRYVRRRAALGWPKD